MQPKAAKKIGGMTPKKMTGGEDTKEFDFDGTKYFIKKTQKDDKLEICVSADMPTGSMVEPPADPAAAADKDKPKYIKPDPEAKEGSDINPVNNVNAAREAAAIAEAEAEEEREKAEADGSRGGKKKRKSSKKRKSMKKKGGMRKSMKVKA